MKCFDLRMLGLVVITGLVIASIDLLVEHNQKPGSVDDYAMAEPFSLTFDHTYFIKRD